MFDHGNIVSGEAPTLISHSGGRWRRVCGRRLEVVSNISRKFLAVTECADCAALHMASLFVTARIPIRWVMMTTVVLAAFIRSMASKSTRSPR